MVGIYWNNHHHLMQIVDTIDGRTLWANMHLLFWLSLMPLGTAWLGEAGVKTGPVAAYAIVLLGCAIAFTLLTLALLAIHETGSQLAQAIGSDRKGKLSLALYVARARGGLVGAAVGLDRALRRRRGHLVPARPPGRARRSSSRSAQAGDETTRSDSRVGHVDDVARPQLASAAALRLAVDGDRERADQVLRLAARVDDAGELQQLAEADELARHLDVAHLLGLRGRGRARPQAVRILRLRLGRVVVAGPGPGRERQQDAGVLGRAHAVALARLEQDDRALAAGHRRAPARELDAARARPG